MEHRITTAVCGSDSGGCGFGLVWLVLVWCVVRFWFGLVGWCGVVLVWLVLVWFGFNLIRKIVGSTAEYKL